MEEENDGRLAGAYPVIKEIYFGKEGRDKIISGVNKLNKAVATTMGPNGNTVVVPDKSKHLGYTVTKDGVTVANNVHLKCPVENIGADFIRGAAQKTVEQAGDGTTTATVLATAFVNNLKNFGTVEINKAFDTIIPQVIEQLKFNSRELKREDIKHVACISANNDVQIGDILQQAFNHSDIVKVEESDALEDKLELVDGMSLKVSYFSKNFITDEKKGVCELIEPHVLILDGKLEKLDNLKAPIEHAIEPGQSLLIIVEDIHKQVLMKLESLVLSNDIKLCVIKAPGFSKHRKDLLGDIAKFTGGVVISDYSKPYSPFVLGKLKSCRISKTNSILVKAESVDVNPTIETLQSLTDNPDYTDYDKELLAQRVEYLKGKVSIVRVGGKTPHEIKERLDRYDDAVKAVACGLEEGIVEGGGKALGHIGQVGVCRGLPILELAIWKSLVYPYQTIKDNGAEVYLNVNMFEKNIIDPLKVTRCALENAVSVAKVILSTEAVVLNPAEWN
jgi:chaperonin GroEL